MVLPILGLLGAAALYPHYGNYTRNVRSNQLRRKADRAGIDLNTATPDQLGRFGMQSGFLDMSQGIDVLEGQRDFDRGVFENDRAFNENVRQFDKVQDFREFQSTMEHTMGMIDTASGGQLDAGALWNTHPMSESSNRYFLDDGSPVLGPVIQSGIHKGDQAGGRYGVMPNTLKMWSQEVFGRDVSFEEFLENPDLQDQLYYEKFIKVAQTEGIENALSKWHSGKSFDEIRAAGPNGPRDQNMSTLQYVAKNMAAYKRQAQQNERGRVVEDMRVNSPELHKIFTNEATPAARKQQAYDEHIARMGAKTAAAGQPQNEIFAEQVQTYGMGWNNLAPADRRTVIAVESAISDVSEVIDYFKQSTALGRFGNKERREEMSGIWNMTVLPFLQQMTDAGAMQEAELELFQEWAGDPNTWKNFSNANRGKMNSILRKMYTFYADEMAALGLNPRELDPLADLTPVFPEGADAGATIPGSGVSPHFDMSR